MQVAQIYLTRRFQTTPDYSSCDENKVIEIAVEFTPRQCWTYLWKSCRWTNAQEHAFHVYILAPIPGYPDFLARVAQFSR